VDNPLVGNTLKTLLYTGLGLLLLSIAAVLVIPGLIDWNQYKGQIVDRIADELGREFVVSGDISLSIIPKTKFSLNGVYIGNIDGASASSMAQLKSLDVEVALAPLLMGSIEIVRVILVEPVIVLERLQDGRANWTWGEGNDADGELFPRSVSRDISFDEVVIYKGSLEYIDPSRGIRHQIEDADIRFSSPSLTGPFYLSGQLKTRGVDVLIEEVVVELDAQNNVRARGDILTNGLLLEFTAGSRVEELGPSYWLGKIKLSRDEASHLPSFTDGWSQNLLNSENEGPEAIQFASDFLLRDGVLKLSETKFRLGEIKGSGSGAVGQDGFQVQVDLGHLNLDKVFNFGRESSVDKLSSDAFSAATTALLSYLVARPELMGTVRIGADAVQFRGEAIRDILLNGDIRDGAIDLNEVSALFPGGSVAKLEGTLHLDKGLPAFVGVAEGKSDNFRALLDWLSLDTRTLSGDRLRRLWFSTKLGGTLASGSFTDIELEFDTSNVRGGVDYEIANGRPGLGVGLRIDQLNLDAYYPKTANSEDESLDEPGAGTKLGFWLPNIFSKFDANFDMELEDVTFRGIPVSGVVLDGLWQQDVLKVREIGIDNLSGTSVSFAGLLTGVSLNPSIQGSFVFSAERLGSLARIIPALQDAPKYLLGSTEINLAVRGNEKEITIDGMVEAMDSRMAIRGSVTDPLLPGELGISSELEIASLAKFGELLSNGGVVVPESLLRADVPLNVKVKLAGISSHFDLEALAETIDARLEVFGSVTGFPKAPQFDVEGSFYHPSIGTFYEKFSRKPIRAFATLKRPMEVDLALQGVAQDFIWEGMLGMDALNINGSGHFDAGHNDIKILLDHPNTSILASDFGFASSSGFPEGGASLVMFLQSGQTGVKVPEFSLNIAGNDISGTLDFDVTGQTPKLNGNFKSGRLDLDGLLLLFSGDQVDSVDVNKDDFSNIEEPILDSDFVANVPFVNDAVDARFALEAVEFRTLGQTFKDADIRLRIQESSTRVELFSGRWRGGVVALTGQLGSGLARGFNVAVQFKDADLKELLPKYAGLSPISGRATLEGNFTGEGRNAKEILTSLGGSGRINGVDEGIIEGVNLRGFSDQLESLENPAALLDLIQIILDGGQTKFSGLNGTFQVEKGKVRTEDLAFLLDGGRATVSGIVDLDKWTQDLELEFYLTDHPSVPPIQLHLNGDIQFPGIGLRTTELQAYMLSTLPEILEMPSNVEGIIGELEELAVEHGLEHDSVIDVADDLIERLIELGPVEQEVIDGNIQLEEHNDEEKFRTLLQELLSD
jgi:uncharacterized protein involved in outer membrane biogenesis